MFGVYKSLYPDVEIINATVAGGAGTNAKAVLATRLEGGDPPDSFQVHAGLEVEKYSPTDYLSPLDEMLDAEVYPADLLQMLKYEGHYWSIPVNIHRSNVLCTTKLYSPMPVSQFQRQWMSSSPSVKHSRQRHYSCCDGD